MPRFPPLLLSGTPPLHWQADAHEGSEKPRCRPGKVLPHGLRKAALKDGLIWALIGGLITRGILRPRRYFSRLELTHLRRIRSFLLFHAITDSNELAQGSAHRLHAPQAGKEFLAAAL